MNKESDQLPGTLLDLLSNVLVLDATLPYLPLSAIFRLAAVSKSFRALVYQTPRIFRYLDLSTCHGAYVPPTTLSIGSRGHTWWAERMAENRTRDKFYSRLLRGVLTKLSNMGIMKDVQTLVLDGLGSVTHVHLSDILLSPEYNVRLLSVINCPNINKHLFQILLQMLSRVSRPEKPTRLQGVYIFGSEHTGNQPLLAQRSYWEGSGITTRPGAQLGAQAHPISTGSQNTPSSSIQYNANPWFSPMILPTVQPDDGSWAKTLRVCSGIIAFDAVLCTHMHAEMQPYRNNQINAYLTSHRLTPPIATIALGSAGCVGCGAAPQGAPIWGVDDVTAFPLVSPPPFSGRLIDAVRPSPPSTPGELQRLVVSCMWCLSDRHCQLCQGWWCAKCYDPITRKFSLQLKAQAESKDYDGSRGEDSSTVKEELGQSSAHGGMPIKLYNGICTHFCAFSEDLAAGNGAMWG